VTQASGSDRRPAAISHQVRVQWSDTDASGHYHHSSILRWVEIAEAALYRSLGIDGIFGVVPRVRYAVDYLTPLWFGDEATVRIWVERLGDRSLELRFEVVGPTGSAVARGQQVVVHVSQAGGASASWPADWREQLAPAAVGRGVGAQRPAEHVNAEGHESCVSQ
jgi:acyl-CoA thioester hydrolase